MHHILQATWIERWQSAGVVYYDWPPYQIRGMADESGVFEYVVTVDQSEITSAPWPALEDLKTTCQWDARFRYSRTKKRRLARTRESKANSELMRGSEFRVRSSELLTPDS